MQGDRTQQILGATLEPLIPQILSLNLVILKI